MNLSFLKNLRKYIGWKSLLLVSPVILAACSGACQEADCLEILFVMLLAILILLLAFIFRSEDVEDAALRAERIEPIPTTNAAVFSVNWNKKETAHQAGGNFQLSLPFSDYTRAGDTVKPDNHMRLNGGFHFGMPLLAEKDEHGNLPENIDEAKQANTPFSLSLTPVASNQQQLAENTAWLSAEENMPLNNALSASKADNVVRLYQPITLKRDNQVIATMNSMVVEKNQIQQGNSLNISLEGIYSPLKSKEINTNNLPGHFVFELKNLDAMLVHQLEKEVQDIKHLPKDKQMLMQIKMLKQLKALCKKGSTLSVTYDANTLSGPVKQHYTVDLSELNSAPTQFSGPMPLDLGLIFGEQ
ncbi:MAG: hypothetical protein P1U61_02325 [Legionellaceae bacterium]|nr:hypothetical protein [Legionellaceae bacterium]